MKESNRKCFKCGISQHDNPHISLHRFPRPGSTNSLRCELWAKYCFPEMNWSCQKFQTKLFSEHKMLCNKHFKKNWIMDSLNKKLHRSAVPDIEQNESMSQTESSHDLEPSHDLEASQKLEKPHDLKLSHDLEASQYLEVPHDLEASQYLEMPHDLEESQEPEASPDDSRASPEFEDLETLHQSEALDELEMEPSYEIQNLQKPQHENIVTYVESGMTRREKYLFEICMKQKKKIRQLRNIIKRIKYKTLVENIHARNNKCVAKSKG